MKKIVFTLSCLLALSSLVLKAQTGAPFIHDPSTLAECDGKYYTFGTGGGGLISDDGWSWHSGAERPGGGAAPDVVKIGNRYLVAYSSTGGGLGGRHSGRILTMWNKTLDPSSPDFRFTEPIEVARWTRRQRCHRCRSLARPHHGTPVVQLWNLFRTHPHCRTRPSYRCTLCWQ